MYIFLVSLPYTYLKLIFLQITMNDDMDATKFNPSAVAGGARALGPISSCNI